MVGVGSPVGTAISVAVLLVVITAAVDPAGLRILPLGPAVPVSVVAVGGAALLMLLGLVEPTDAWSEFSFMAPTIGFLAAMLVVAEVCAVSGVFRWVGGVLVRLSRGAPGSLLRVVFVAAALTTAALSLDTTVLLLTPVVVAAARRVGAKTGPPTYASVHLANSASTLLPVSNLTNLLAFSATGLGFLHFAGLMAGPWIAAIVVEYLIFRWYFAGRLDRNATEPTAPQLHDDDGVQAPIGTLVMLGLLLLGFVIAEPLGIALVLVAAVGAIVMTVPLLRRNNRRETTLSLARSVNLPFLGFVAALGIIVLPVRSGPIGDGVATLIPDGTGLLALAGVAVLAAVAANLLNNLPATLLLLPLVADRPALALAMLLGVNIGPNLTHFGSLANLLWRDVLRRRDAPAPAREFILLGAVTVPLTLGAAVLALWLGTHWIGP